MGEWKLETKNKEQQPKEWSPAERWLKKHWPNMRVMEIGYTDVRYGYPVFVVEWIQQHWVRLANMPMYNDCCYAEPNYWENKKQRKKKKSYW